MFVSALLLFLIQPIFAKEILPLLGGAPAVWNTCLVFYEVMLLLGYLYAFLVQRWLNPTIQRVTHLLLVIAVLAFLPVSIRALTPPSITAPVEWLLLTLTLSLGLPLLVLSASSPLLQSWFAASTHERSADPYFLYAASNAGSLIGLLIYPFVLEPLTGLHLQSLLWRVGYFILMACIGVAIFNYRAAEKTASLGIKPPSMSGNDPTTPSDPPPVSKRRILQWILLAFVPSSLMLSVTTYMATDIAPIPLLWVVPLALYLITFIIAFSQSFETRLATLRNTATILMLPLVVAMAAQTAWPRPLLLALHLIAFFLIALTCHSILAADRPDKKHLAQFYLWLATGGALGGVFTALLAPLMFKTVVEYPLMLVIAAFLIRGGSIMTPAEGIQSADRRARLLDLAAPVLLGGSLALFLYFHGRENAQALATQATFAFAFSALVTVLWLRRPMSFALSIAALMLCSILYAHSQETKIYGGRNFYGIPTVLAFGTYHVFVHSGTIHGIENTLRKRRDDPLTYYERSGPLGQIFAALQARLAKASVAVVGLGVGSAMCYRAPGQLWTIYEIDPSVDNIARDPRLFNFVSDCSPSSPTVIGDARLSLEQAPNSTYKLMILDAYSSDYIPVHLITREALALYLQKMTIGGLLAFHITNHWFDLEPVLASLARDSGLACLAQYDRKMTSAQAGAGKFESQWVLMARETRDLGPLMFDRRWYRPHPGHLPVWTDDYSSLVTTLKVLHR